MTEIKLTHRGQVLYEIMKAKREEEAKRKAEEEAKAKESREEE